MMRDNNKILFVSYYFPPSGGSGVLRIVRFVKNLGNLGRQPYVLTVDEKDIYKLGYGTTHADDSYAYVKQLAGIKYVRLLRPSHVALWAYKCIRVALSQMLSLRAKQRFEDNVQEICDEGSRKNREVKNIKSYHSSDISRFLKVVFEIIFIIDQIFEWAPRAILLGIRYVRRKNIGIICSSSPPWSVHIVGYALKLFNRSSWIVDLRDPIFNIDKQQLETFTSHLFIKTFYRYLEAFVMRKADIVICNCPEIKEYYEHKYPVTQFEVIVNSYDPDDYSNINIQPVSEGSYVIGHFGALYQTIREPDSFLKAFAAVLEHHPYLRDSVRVHFYGAAVYTDSKSFRDLIEELDIVHEVECHGYLQHDFIIRKMASASLLLLLQPHASTNFQIPAKLYEYIALRKPLLAVAPNGSATASLIKENRLGLVCDPDDSASIEAAIAGALKGEIHIPGEQDIEQFSAKQMAAKLVEVMDSL